MALGATTDGVLAMVLRQGLSLVGVGLVVGVVVALALGRVLRNQLFETPTADPLAFAGVVAVLGLAALLACLGPAWRAMRVDPVTALRAD
jgi:ABC-type antimicrobial peptide transport system permease subunit